MKTKILFLIILSNFIYSQNIYSAIHLNDGPDIKSNTNVIEIKDTYTLYGITKNEKYTEFYFLENNLVKTYERYNEEGVLKFKYINTYNDAKKIIHSETEENIPLIGKQITKKDYLYDSNNFLVKIIEKDRNDNVFDEIYFKNDEKGNPIELASLKSSAKEIAEYDYANNQFETSVLNENGEKISSNIILLNYKYPANSVFNEYNDVIRFNNTVYEYKYDKYGNWIKKNIYNLYDGKKILKNEYFRKIKYK